MLDVSCPKAGAGLTSGATPALGVAKSMDQVLPGSFSCGVEIQYG